MSAWDGKEGEATQAGLRVALSLSSNRPSKGTLCSHRGARMPLHGCTPNTQPRAHTRACFVGCAQCVKLVCVHTHSVHVRTSITVHTHVLLLSFYHALSMTFAHVQVMLRTSACSGELMEACTCMCQRTRAQRHLHTRRGTHRRTAVRTLDASPQPEISLLV